MDNRYMGRPREFDETEVLVAAIDCFWERGYEARSIRELADKMGLTGASLYNAFGDKRTLYCRALHHYIETTFADRVQPLEGRTFVADEQYTIADMASYPWVVPWKRQQHDLQAFPNLQRWFSQVRARPSTIRAYEKGDPFSNQPTVTEEGKKLLFGQTAHNIPSRAY
ncbi:TetR family transcriptional regulator [Escherichia coli]|nr:MULTISPECIES: TetR family transcriptional regulator [Enterobacteriaceae]